jgi:hypothetical protein
MVTFLSLNHSFFGAYGLLFFPGEAVTFVLVSLFLNYFYICYFLAEYSFFSVFSISDTYVSFEFWVVFCFDWVSFFYFLFGNIFF